MRYNQTQRNRPRWYSDIGVPRNNKKENDVTW